MSFLFCTLLCSTTYAQATRERDSLLQHLHRVGNDTNKVKLLYELSEQYDLSEVEKARDYIFQAKQLSQQLGYESGILRFHKRMMYIHAVLSHNDSAIWYGRQILRIATAQKDTYQMGVASFNIGERYNYKSDYETGLRYMLEGQKMLEAGNYPPATKAAINGSIAAAYLMIKDYEKSISYGKQAETIERTLNNKVPLTGTLINLANAYTELKRYSEAEKTYAEVMQLVQSNNNSSYESMALTGMIDLANRQNKTKDIKRYSERSLQLASQLGDSSNLASSMQGLSVYYLRTGNFSKAKEWSMNALQIVEKNSYKEQKASILENLSHISFATHDYTDGYKYASEALGIRSGIFTESLAAKQADMREKYESEKREAQILLQKTQLRQKNLLNYLAFGSVAALAVILLMGYRSNQHKQGLQQVKIAELETEKQLLATQALLQGQEDERSRLAKDLHDGLGGMLSGVKLQLGAMKGNLILTEENGALFNNALNKLNQSISEMRRVAHNMMPEALIQLGLEQALQDYCNSIGVAGTVTITTEFYGLGQRLSATTEVTVYRIVQELVNNAVKHSEAQNLLVQVMRREQSLNITVEDNGKGFDAVHWQEKPTAGLQNIQSRVHYLGGHMDIKSIPGKGTSVYIECTIESNG